MIGFGCRARRYWRPMIGIVVAYAIAAQSLLIAAGGFALPSSADVASPDSALCVHDGQSPAQPPADIPRHSEGMHCILCIPGPHHALTGAPPVLVRHAAIHASTIDWPTDLAPFPGIPAHSIANPRGPPPGA